MGSMWMSLAPFEIADIRTTFTSLMTGASSPCRASVSALISSRSSMTSTSLASAVSPGISSRRGSRHRARFSGGTKTPGHDCPAAAAGPLLPRVVAVERVEQRRSPTPPPAPRCSRS